jgi:hypothetical protein
MAAINIPRGTRSCPAQHVRRPVRARGSPLPPRRRHRLDHRSLLTGALPSPYPATPLVGQTLRLVTDQPGAGRAHSWSPNSTASAGNSARPRGNRPSRGERFGGSAKPTVSACAYRRSAPTRLPAPSSARQAHRDPAIGPRPGSAAPGSRDTSGDPVLWTQRRRVPRLNPHTFALRFDVLEPDTARVGPVAGDPVRCSPTSPRSSPTH